MRGRKPLTFYNERWFPLKCHTFKETLRLSHSVSLCLAQTRIQRCVLWVIGGGISLFDLSEVRMRSLIMPFVLIFLTNSFSDWHIDFPPPPSCLRSAHCLDQYWHASVNSAGGWKIMTCTIWWWFEFCYSKVWDIPNLHAIRWPIHYYSHFFKGTLIIRGIIILTT